MCVRLCGVLLTFSWSQKWNPVSALNLIETSEAFARKLAMKMFQVGHSMIHAMKRELNATPNLWVFAYYPTNYEI